MYTLLVTIHIIICIFLVCIVLLQKGKGAEIGAVFGSSEALFGAAGPATFLNKLTTVTAILFMLTSLGLTYMSAKMSSKSVMESVAVQQKVPAGSPAEAPSAPLTDVNKGGNPVDAGKQTGASSENAGQHLAVSVEKVEDQANTAGAKPDMNVTPAPNQK